MNELPPHTGGLPASPGSSPGVEKSKPQPEFKGLPVRPVDPGPGLIGGSPSERKPVTPKAELRERGAGFHDTESNHSSSAVSEEAVSSKISDYEGQYYFGDEEAGLFDGNIRGPSMNFPVSAHHDTDGASTLTGLSVRPESAVADQAVITIEGGGPAQNNSPDALDDASITIEGGGQISKSAIKSVFKKVWNWAVDFARNNKIAVTVALVALFCIVMATPGGAAIVGATFAAGLGGFGAALCCGLAGYAIAHFIGKTSLFSRQVPPPANPPTKNPDTGQQQQNPTAQPEPSRSSSQASSAASSTSGSAKSAPASEPHKTDGIARSDGQFFLTPTEKMSRAAEASAAAENQAAKTAGAEPEEPFSMAVFNEWLANNISRWSSEQQLAKLSKDLGLGERHEDWDSDGVLEDFLNQIDDKRLQLATLASSPLTEPTSSAGSQKRKLDEYSKVFDSLLGILNPTAEQSRHMLTQLLRLLPQERFPWVSSDLWSPLLSTGNVRQSLDGLPRQELAKLEASDFLRLSLQALDSYANRKAEEEEYRHYNTADYNPEMPGVIELKSSDEHSHDKTTFVARITPDDSDDRSPSSSEGLDWDDFQPAVLPELKRLPDLQNLDDLLPQVAQGRVRVKAFFNNIITATAHWNSSTHGQSAGNEPDRTSKHLQSVAINSMAEGIIEAGARMMREEQGSISFTTPGGRESFLAKILASDEVARIFASIKVEESVWEFAKDHFRRSITGSK